MSGSVLFWWWCLTWTHCRKNSSSIPDRHTKQAPVCECHLSVSWDWLSNLLLYLCLEPLVSEATFLTLFSPSVKTSCSGGSVVHCWCREAAVDSVDGGPGDARSPRSGRSWRDWRVDNSSTSSRRPSSVDTLWRVASGRWKVGTRWGGCCAACADAFELLLWAPLPAWHWALYLLVTL